MLKNQIDISIIIFYIKGDLDMNFIDPSVLLDPSVKVGHFSVVEKDAKIGKNVVIGNRVTIHEGTVIGDDTTIADGAVFGKAAKAC